jgi:titin
MLDGTGSPSDGLTVAASNTSIVNLTIANYVNGSGVLFTGTSHGKVQGSRIGTNQTGTTAARNQHGIWISNSTNILIGTDGDGIADTAERNVISGNSGYGVLISGTTASSNRIAGNYIGTNAAGAAEIANGHDGIRIEAGASNNMIGGSLASQRNVVSGNAWSGIVVAGAGVQNNTVAGNYVGTNAAGTATIPNSTGDWDSHRYRWRRSQ